MRWRRAGKKTALVVAALVVASAVAWAIPASRAGIKAAAVLAHALDVNVPRPFAPRVRVRTIELRTGAQADVYAPLPRAPSVVVVHGAAVRGKDDPRVVRLARALAGAGRTVVVPQLELRRRVFHLDDVETIVAAVEHTLSGPDGKAGMLGFSYGGSLALVAAGEPRIAERLAFVATFGAYADLTHVVQGVTTGATIVDGRVRQWRTLPQARTLLTRAALDLAPPDERASLDRALRLRDPSALSPDARSFYDLLVNRDPRRAEALAARLPGHVRRIIREVSPLHRMKQVRAPVLLMQSLQDPATPPTEVRLLSRATRGARVVILREFLHVTPPASGERAAALLGDGRRAWRFTRWIIAAQE